MQQRKKPRPSWIWVSFSWTRKARQPLPKFVAVNNEKSRICNPQMFFNLKLKSWGSNVLGSWSFQVNLKHSRSSPSRKKTILQTWEYKKKKENWILLLHWCVFVLGSLPFTKCTIQSFITSQNLKMRQFSEDLHNRIL